MSVVRANLRPVRCQVATEACSVVHQPSRDGNALLDDARVVAIREDESAPELGRKECLMPGRGLSVGGPCALDRHLGRD